MQLGSNFFKLKKLLPRLGKDINIMEKADILIRSAELSDIDALVELLKVLFSIEKDFIFNASTQRFGLQLMIRDCRKHRCIVVAEIKNKVIGMCSAQTLISTAEGGVVALVEDMVVHQDFRRKGVGKKLLHAIDGWAEKKGVKRLQLLADRTNQSALAFYKNLNWKTTQLTCLRKK